MADAGGSKAKYIREALDRALELKIPGDMTPEQFERTFAMKVTPEELKNLTFAELLVRQLVVKACAGNDRSISEVLDRLLGKPMQTTENVTKSYNYYDFLTECSEKDEREVIDVKPVNPRLLAPPGRETPKRILTNLPPGDPYADLL